MMFGDGAFVAEDGGLRLRGSAGSGMLSQPFACQLRTT